LALEEPILRLLAGHRPTEALSDTGAEAGLAQQRYVAISHYSEAGPERDSARMFRQIASATADLGISLACATDLHGCSVGVFESESRERTTDTQIRDWLLDETRRALGGREARSGCGISAAGELSEVRTMFARASQAAFICLHLYREESVVSWDQVAPLASSIAVDVPGADSGRTAALTALLLDPDSFAFDTVGAVLRSGRDQSPADILHVHRTTLHYRLQQIVELTGLDLAVPTDRFLAITVWLRVALSVSPLAGLVKSS
jgi:sugar diacid utilization regulator